MQYDLIYPESECELCDAPCIVAAVWFSREELLKLGVESNAVELDATFIEENEFTKAFKLWLSPLYLSDFYDRFRELLNQDYWHGISEPDFQKDVNKSICRNRRELLDKMQHNDFASLVKPLDDIDEEKRLCESIRVKIKQGVVGGHHPFRFYAIEVEENKCYIITGATIKVHKDMKKASNTEIELEKLKMVSEELIENDVIDKESFINFIRE